MTNRITVPSRAAQRRFGRMLKATKRRLRSAKAALASWRSRIAVSRKRKTAVSAQGLARRTFLAGAFSVAGLASANAAMNGFPSRVQIAALPPAVPVLTPTSFVVTSGTGSSTVGQTFHTLANQPIQSTQTYGTGWLERPSVTVDIPNDWRMKDGQDLVPTATVGHGDPAKGGIQRVRWTLVGDTTAVTADSALGVLTSPAAPLGNGAAFGYQSRLSVPTSTRDRVMFLFVEVFPVNGRSQMIVRRILVEGSARLAADGSNAKASVFYISPLGSAGPKGPNGETPTADLNLALRNSSNAGTVYIDAGNGPLLVNTYAAGYGNNYPDYIEVHPYNGTRFEITRTGPIPLAGGLPGYQLVKPDTVINSNKVAFFNGKIDTRKFWNFTTGVAASTTFGSGIGFNNCLLQDDLAAAGDHFFAEGALSQNDSLSNFTNAALFKTSDLTASSYELYAINCTGTTLVTSCFTLKVGCSFELGWDIVYTPSRSEYSFAHVSTKEVQNRLGFAVFNSAANGGLKITSVSPDADNERAFFGVAMETFPGKAAIQSVDSNGTATVALFLADGTTPCPIPFFISAQSAAYNQGTTPTVVFDNGALSGAPLQVASIPANYSTFTIANTGLPQTSTSTGAALTFKFMGIPDSITSGIGTAYNGSQLRIMSGAAKSPFIPSDLGYESLFQSKYTADYSVPNTILKGSFPYLMASSGFGAGTVAAPQMQVTPKATVAGVTLTAVGDTTNGSGGLTSAVDPISGGTYVTCSGGSSSGIAGLKWGATIIATLTDGSTITMRAARAINATASVIATGGFGSGFATDTGILTTIPAYSFFIKGALSTALTGSNVASWKFAWNNHGLTVNSLVQFGSNAKRRVVSVQGAQVTLDAPLDVTGDITTPTTFSHFVGTVAGFVVVWRTTNDFGTPILTPLPANDDRAHMTQGIQHYDNFQYPQITQPSALPRVTNVTVANSVAIGNNLQALQIQPLGGFSVGTMSVTAGATGQTTANIGFNLPTLPITSILNTSPSTYHVFGKAYAGFKFTSNYSGITGSALFQWVNPGRPIRVLFKTGPYAGQSFRLYTQTFSGTIATFILLDDQNVLNGGAWAGSTSDTFQHPLPFADDDMIVVGTGAATAFRQARIFVNDPVNVGSGTIDQPWFTASSAASGSVAQTTFSNLSAVSYSVAVAIQDVNYVGSFNSFGLSGQKMTLNNVLGGGVRSPAVIRNFNWAQTTWFIGEDPRMLTTVFFNGGLGRRCSVIDSLHSGFECSSSADHATFDTPDISIVNTLFGFMSSYGPVSPNGFKFAQDPRVKVNNTLTVDAATGLPSITAGAAIPTIAQGSLSTKWDCFGNAINDNGAALVGCRQAA